MTVTDMRDGTVTSSTVNQVNVGIKAAVKAATTANITLSGAQTIDGVSVVTGDRVLVKDQSTASGNGIYDVDSSGTWSRPDDFDAADEIVLGTLISVAPGGTVNGGTLWQVSAAPTTLETDTVSFTEKKSFKGTITPTASDGAALGTSSLMWSDAFLASGGVINWNAGDVTITHATNSLTFAGASSGYNFDAKIFPTTNDGAPLGDVTHNFSDLFLASGAVVNWNNGDVTLTHAADTLTFAGAATYTFDVAPKVGASAVYYAGGTDVAAADGGTGASTLTAHAVVLGNGTSAVNFAAPGTAGTALVSGGASSDPTFVAIGAVKITAQTASTSGELDFTSGIDSTYRKYIIEIDNLLPATDAVNLLFEVSTDAGATYKTTSYVSGIWNFNTGGASGGAASTGAISLATSTNISNSSGYGWSGTIVLHNPSNATTRKHAMFRGGYLVNAAGGLNSVYGSGYWDGGNTAINAFRLILSTGNIASGTVTVYGMKG